MFFKIQIQQWKMSKKNWKPAEMMMMPMLMINVISRIPNPSISDLDDFIITDDDNDVDIYNEEDEVRKKLNFIKLSSSFFL